MPDDLSNALRTKAAAEFLHMAQTTLERWRFMHKGPVYYKIGNVCLYRVEDLVDFALAGKREPNGVSRKPMNRA